MKKQTKRVVGLCGLAVVGVTTAVAATLPTPYAAATDGELQQTDTVVVRVVSDNVEVHVGGVTSGSTIVSPKQTLTVDYSNGVDKVSAKLIYTDIYGNTDEYDFGEKIVDYQGGVWELPVDLTTLVGAGGMNFSYGHYKFVAVGVGNSGEPSNPDALEFDYAGAIMTDGGVDENDNVIINIESDGKYTSEITPYGGDGQPINCAKVTVPAGTTQTILPFGDCGLPSGTYKLVLNSLDANGKIVSSFTLMIDYIAPGDIPVPDTGIFTTNMNISRTDYLITGLIVFGVIAVFGIVMIVKRNRSSKEKK